MRQAGVTALGVAVKTKLLNARLFDFRSRQIFRQDGEVRPIERDPTAGFGDLGELGLVGVGVALLGGELWLNTHVERFLFVVGYIGQQLIDVAAV